ncbi:MAG TPA: hypothetical protein ENI51_04770, partial [Candidatus Atribacteria bacterium]|nr:hypothetical protein [Candidatus Atribacteria bacterium]
MILKKLDNLTFEEIEKIEELMNYCEYSTPFHEIKWLKIIQEIFEEEILVILKYNNKHLAFFLPIIAENE